VPDFVTYPHPALSKKTDHRKIDSGMLAAGQALLAAAQDVRAYGLAAAHLGLDEPLAVVSFATKADERDYRILYNPEVLQLSEETEAGAEGSVSLPGIEVPVKRAVWADIAYDDSDGFRHVERVEGFVARVAQHEIDQVEGVFFLRRVSAIKRDTALRKFTKSRSPRVV
jgi:peptide deformylase